MASSSFDRLHPVLCIPNQAGFEYHPQPSFACNWVAAPAADAGFDAKSCNVAPQPWGGFLATHTRVYRCAHEQCNILTRIAPYCALHTRKLLKLQVRPSSITAAGLGLFAIAPDSTDSSFDHFHNYCEPIAVPTDFAVALTTDSTIIFNNGDLIYYMEGEILSWKQYEERYGSRFDTTDQYWFTPYAARLPDGRIIDAISCRGVMACANDPRDHSRVNIAPMHPDRRPTRMPLFANRTIRAGDELFVSYGQSWWTAFPAEQSWQRATESALALMTKTSV